MQRQKTIAKWLAIILLLTSIIACYIAFSSIIKNKNALPPDIAGANTDSDNNKPDDTQTTPKPVYSVFPRASEDVSGISVSHVGGEDNDRLLDTLYYIGKRYVFFYSASTQYDVRECGIHIAVFENNTLLSTVKVAGADESFIDASIVGNGVLVLTKNAAQTRLRLLNENLSVICEDSCPLYSDYRLYVTSAGIRLYTADERFIYSYTVTDTLEAKRSQSSYPIDNGKLFYTAGLGAYDVIITQSAQGVGLLTFSASDGFVYKGEIAGCRLMQVLPFSSQGKPVFLLISKCNEGIAAVNLDENLQKLASYTFKNAQTAVAVPGDNSNVCIFTDKTISVFCSHLELQSSADVNIEEYSENMTYSAIDGERDYFIISQGSSRQIVKIQDNALVCKLKFIGGAPIVLRENIKGTSDLSLLFDGNINNSFANMCFGASDVFYINGFTA